MAAYGAMVSLLGVLDSTLHPGHNKIQLNSLREKVCYLVLFLENSDKISEAMETKIRDAAYKAEDILESRMSKQLPKKIQTRNYYGPHSIKYLFYAIYFITLIVIHRSIHLGIQKVFPFSIQIFISVIYVAPFLIQALLPVYFRKRDIVILQILAPFTVKIVTLALILNFISILIMFCVVVYVISFAARSWDGSHPEDKDLRQVAKEIESIADEVTRIEDVSGGGAGQDVLHQRTLSKRDSYTTVKSVVVGFDSDLVKIKAQLSCGSSELEIVPIVGMGGIGKTTLARQVFDDSYIVDSFETRAWVTVSQEYSLQEVLIGLLDSAKVLTEEMYKMKAEQLVLCLHKSLFNVKYLIVVDDVWDTQIWDSMRRSFPDDNSGSRVLLTTRLSGVAHYAKSSSTLHEMRFLDEDDSWKLLCNKVFGGKDCPDELKVSGKEIARNCEGLPLAIAVIGGLLSKAPRTNKYWTSVVDNLSSIVSKDDKQCMEILSLSYNHLPHRLRACFLYMGAFPEDYEIPVPKLIRLWVAEGFLTHHESKSLEELAEEYLKDLIERNLVLVCKRSINGKIKTCKTHDLLRNLCISNAHKENFLYVVKCHSDVLKVGANDPRRLSIDPDFLGYQTEILDKSDIHNLTAHSILCSGTRLIYPSRVYLAYRLLRVLDLVIVRFFHFPNEIIELVNLRYLAFTYNETLPSSISKLWNLQTIVVHNWTYGQCPTLPVEIWLMSNLRHIIITPSFLDTQNLVNGPVLDNLHTLLEVRNFICGENILKRIPNVKHLGFSYDVSPTLVWSEYHLETLVNLHGLETLKLVFTKKFSHTSKPSLALPHSLTRLTLTGCEIPWKSMTIIGALPNLEVLKLKKNGCLGKEWGPQEDEYSRLKYLLLEELDLMQWRVDDSHFPCLKRLVIRSCYKLKEIPFDIGELPSLEMIEMVDCHHSAVTSARIIEEEQRSNGNDDLKVVVDSRRRFNNKFYSRVLH